eukprot:Phypoly_transcript_10880.p1 GENE.Phypoly_transcript_10880~~Phypoly_transcript_10880.p1  ORF type:complete len:384 (+),score=165.74 Phypoly_transcript_10880:93-1244(+)
MSDPSSMTVAQLREELSELGLPTTGLKAELVKRLREHKSSGKRKSDEDEEDEKPAKKAKKTEKKDVEEKKPTRGPSKRAAAKKPKKEEEEEEEEEEKEEEKKETKGRGKKAAAKKPKKEEEEEEEKEEEKETKGRGKKAGAKKPKKEENEEEEEEKEKEEKEEKEDKKGKGKSAEEKKEDREVTKEAAEEAKSETSADWKWKDSLMYYEMPGVKPSEKLACFDYDGCLAQTSLFKHGPDAWSVRHASIPKRLQELHSQGYKLVIMTNQSDIGKAKPENKPKKIAEKVARLLGFAKAVGLPFQILVATAKSKDASDAYRKPAKGMWTFASENNGGVTPNIDQSFFVGDAAGRKKDHSDADKAFAKAAGLRFFTEDEFFEKNAQL